MLPSEKNLNGLRSIVREEVEAALIGCGGDITGDTIELRSIPRATAKEEIMELLDKSDKLCYFDIAEALNLDLELVVELLSELEGEGLVGGVE